MQIELAVDGVVSSPIAGQDKAIVPGAKVRCARHSVTTAYRNIWEVSVESWQELYERTAAWPALTVSRPEYEGTDGKVILYAE